MKTMRRRGWLAAIILIAALAADLIPASAISADSSGNAVPAISGYLNDDESSGAYAVLENNNLQEDSDILYFSESDGNAVAEAGELLSTEYPDGYGLSAGYSVSVTDKCGNQKAPEGKTAVSLYLPESTIADISGNTLYLFRDETLAQLPYEIRQDESEDSKGKKYIHFETEWLSEFFFAYDTGSAGDILLKNSGSDETDEDLAGIESQDGVYIRSLNTSLFYGASKQEDGTYLWTVGNSSAEGHRFSYRISFSLSGVGEAAADTIEIRIPQHTLKDRDGNMADTTEWSIPSREDIAASTDEEGNINPEEVSDDVNYAYYEDGNDYVIYNFRPVPAGDNGYVELSYVTSKTTFSYIDMQQMEPFTCVMQIGDGLEEDTKKEAEPIITAINTAARITSTYKQYPYSGKIKTWSSSWGDAVKPDNPEDYYYLIWNIRSSITATQHYDFSISDKITSNLGGMYVLGYRFSGQSSYTAENSVTNQTQTGDRWDSVLTAIPLSVYADEAYWEADNTETATVVPTDKVDAESKAQASCVWNWSQPVFKEPTGHFNGYKRADGGYRRYYPSSVFSGTTHYASSLGFKAGEYTRYDLELFNGYDGEEITLSEYGGFDYASWVVGYPIPWTRDTESSSYNPDEPWTAYGHKPVKYELIDEGIYLLNDESGLISSNGSTSRTIENGGIDSSKAIRLTNEDFRINRLQYSWLMQDAEYDPVETGSWVTKTATPDKNDILVFEGKFNGSDEWTRFATYDIYNAAASPVSTYVSSMTSGEIIFAEGQDLTAYRITAANAHYYTEMFTVPYLTLKNSSSVLNLLDGTRNLAIVNNNTGTFYSLADGVPYDGEDYAKLMANDANWTKITQVYHSDTDYACASEKNSSLAKSVVSTSNNVKRRYYTITWKLSQDETVTTGMDGGVTSHITQDGGIFYDLLPEGSIFVPKSVAVSGGGASISSDNYTVTAISNYENTGRTMVVVKITSEASYYTVTFDTRHAWNSIKDYGNNVHNPVAYETGNDSITNGRSDDGGTNEKDKTVMADLSRKTGVTETSETGNKFLYASNDWDIVALTSASSGLTKKVKGDGDTAYSYSSKTHINGEYSYELRFMNSNATTAKNMVFFDSLENYDTATRSDAGTESDWHGTLKSVDVSQLRAKGANPVVYISTVTALDPEKNHDVTDSAVWTRVNDSTDLSAAKAVAIDITKKADGTDFKLSSGDSVVAYLYMQAPSEAPKPDDGENYPYAFNNIYISDTVLDEEGDNGVDFLIHQDFTRISLTVTGDLTLTKTSSGTGLPAQGISFRLYGTSAYGTALDITKRTGSDGSLTITDIEMGSYVLQETDATDDFLLDPSEHTVIIDSKGKTTVDGTGLTSGFSLTNEPRVHTDISFSKRDSVFTGTKLGGAVYRLSGKSDYGNDILVTAVSSNGESDESAKGDVTFKNIEKGTYSLKEITAPDGYTLDSTDYVVVVDDNGNYGIYYRAAEDIYDTRTETVTAYSYTQNLDEKGTKNSSYGNNWNNGNIRGTGRTSASSSAHVVTIPGAETMHVKIVFGGESSSYDWASMWTGSHPEYNANDNYGNSLTGKLGGGSHTSLSNANEYDVDGNTVTFSFRSDGSGAGDGYGYYAVVSADITVQGDKIYSKGDLVAVRSSGSTYTLTNEPLHYITFTKKSSYDNSVLGGARFSLTGTSNNGTYVSLSAESDPDTGTVRFDGLESGTYVLTETDAPEGYDKDETPRAVHINADGKYTITGLTKTKDVYDLYDTKTPDKTITVVKVWNDGETTDSGSTRNHTKTEDGAVVQDPSKLGITIQTEVPEKSTRTYTVIYDANGGSFGD